ncbi:polyhydroxyalkanoic acid system family protein [Enterovirga rhinocerotis]|uniref:Putative polyhydroxyalkanoic acid system protein n=1 Tax=Enterovirga rhinocerotis TaxID=1339210 RepID=A0A4R7C6Z4_9HYPH|nr:polyhydroxyalkanoic acid system family protein [Enterovirga rhinocerotis]TDR94031.1 putative polyhydroxyalkanoic acid system protein [Enterovirga rhinocerotis]
MPKPLVVVIPHELGQAGARRRLETGLEAVKSKFGAQITSIDSSWTGEHLDVVVKAVGQSVTAGLDVAEDTVRVEVQLPWMLALLAEKAKNLIQKEGTLLLEKKKT